MRKVNILLVATLLVGMLVMAFGVGTASAAPDYQCTYHRVAYGQTLASIGRAYGVPWTAIASANNLYNPNYIQAGWTICVPSGGYYGTGGYYNYYGTGGPYYSGYNYYNYYNPYYTNYYGYGGYYNYNPYYYNYPYWYR